MKEEVLQEMERARSQAESMAPGEKLSHLGKMANMAILLMDHHGLNPGEPGGWSFKWDRAWQRAGNCNPARKLITVSSALFSIWDEESCIQTILHEIAHALVPDGKPHSYTWRLKCLELGGDGSTTWGHEGEAKVAEPQRRQPNYEGWCGNEHRHTRVQAPRSGTYYCRTCSPRTAISWYRI